MKRALGFASVLLLVWSGTAQAQEEESEFARPGAYLGIGGVYAIETFQDDLDDDLEGPLLPDVRTSVDNSGGFGLRIGYRIGAYSAVELHFEYVDSFDTKFDVDGVGTFDVEIEVWTLTGNGKLFLSTGRFQPFVSMGLGYIDIDAKNESAGLTAKGWEDLVLRLAGGMDAYATRHLAVTLEVAYVITDADIDDLNYVSLGGGLTFRF